jgi:NAD(P)-dependent dehydrogenase (short-subunit alcohol dehydrogenase family)
VLGGYQVTGKIVIVTGGSTGIGRATSLGFASQGDVVVIASRNTDKGLELVEEIQSLGGQAVFQKTNVQESDEVEQLISRTVEMYGCIDYAVNCAGVEGEGIPFVSTSEQEWDSIIGTNLKGTWLTMRFELEQMEKQGFGSIVNISSVLGLVANRSAIYTASKHGVNGLTKSAALTYASSGIRVNAVCPGYIDTPMVDRAYEGKEFLRTNAISRHPVGRLGLPSEIANAVIWLCSESASFITGHLMTVDGGYSIP